ncbi:MAG TPA: heparin lyase I family protein, partial [Burkholderiales bacterium]|nr:heparin lyase I family protein [Burkholderiales bacterium]
VNDIQTVTGHTGAPTRVLHSLLKQNACTGTAPQGLCSTQDAYLVQPASEPGDMYISFWRKLDPAFVQQVVNSWHVLFEWKSTGDYRVSANIVTFGGTPYWSMRADNVANGNLPQQEFWRVDVTSVPVPIGEWFKFEVFWHRSTGSDGRVWMAINGQKVTDQFGPNIGVNNDPIDRIFLMQHYSGGSYPQEQWTDDVQIWSSFPSAKPGDPWYDGIYGRH